MKSNKNPYTLMFGKLPKQAIPRLGDKMKIVQQFTDTEYSEQLYIITGVRGSGKTVFMTDVSKEISQEKNWIVIELNPEANLMEDLASKLSSENELAELFRKSKINLSFFGFGLEINGTAPITNIETAITKMLETLKKHNKRLLVTIDEVTGSKNMREFASAFQILIRKELPIFLLMTGLFENVEELQNKKNMTFLLRAPKIILAPLNISRMADSYEKSLGIERERALEMARITKGYSFAFQVLGYFCWEDDADNNSALKMFKQYLEENSYEKIWSELSPKDKEIAIGIARSSSKKVSDIRENLGITNNQFNPYKNRLIKKGLIGDDFGIAEFTLPLFQDFILEKVGYQIRI